MARFLAALFCAALLTLGVWLWVGGERGRPADLRGPQIAAGGNEPTAGPALRPAQVPEAPLQTPDTAEVRSDTAPDRQRLPESRVRARSNDLLVRVVDPRERPLAGVPLVLVPGDPARNEPQASTVTDGEGYAVFEDLRSRVAPTLEPWVLWHDVPFQDPPELVLTASVLEASPVVSVQPWSGRVEVVVSELDGEAAPDGTGVELSLVGEEESVNPLLALERPSWAAETLDGSAVFRFVEPGRTWEAKATRPGSEVSSRAAGPGPAGLGDVAVIEVVLGADHAILVYRAVDEAGNPLRKATLVLQHTKFFGRAEERETVTDGEGRFSFDMDRGWVFGQGSVVVSHEARGGAELQGRIRLAVTEEPGKHDMGDVVLVRDPLLARGRVEDLLGNPVPDAEVVADTGRYGDAPLDHGGSSWFGDRVETRSDSDGRFELRGLLATDEIVLQAGKDGRRSPGTPVAEGKTDVVLVLEARYEVTGRLLLDPRVEARSLRLRLVEEQDENAKEHGVDGFDSDGRFSFEDVPPGTYRLDCYLGTDRLETIEGLRVAADLDVGALDLRGRVHRAEIALRGARAPEELRGEIGWRPAGSDEAWQDVGFEGVLIELLTPETPIDVWVRPQGYRFVRLERVSGSREVDLAAPLRVRLDLVTSGELPEFPYTFDPDLLQNGVHVGFPEGPEFLTDENRSVVFLVSSPGPTTVRWHLERKLENGAIGGNVLNGHETTIEILDAGGEQFFRIELDGEALTRLSTRPPW